MPAFGPIQRKDLIRYLKQLGFEGPYSGGKHQFMVKETLRLTIPNPHKGEISKALLGKILRQAAISREEWENLR
jgi:predicted RNA binding protein YcfA (HicA-like mRNA interferase family)